ncbi:MAG: hypothetical protein JWQ19_2002 [Subtercola sp.]|nr:hypothetical protein [Subtercola sp.]
MTSEPRVDSDDATKPLSSSTRRRVVNVVVAVVASVVIIAVIAVAVGGLFLIRPGSVSTLSAATTGEWSKVTLPQPAENGDGTPYDMYVKPGSSKNLLIFFGDGGLSWSESTAVQPVTLGSSIFGGGNFYSPNVPFYVANTFGGILSNEARNPFADWTTVYIPTTTGDLGIGDATAKFIVSSGSGSSGPKTVTARFNGYNNSSAALAWVYANVAMPGKVMVAGGGTGGLTASFWLSKVGDHYSSAALYEYSDSAYYAATLLSDVIDPVWEAKFEQRFGYTLSRAPLKDAVTFNTARFGDRLTTLISQTLLDKTDATFSADLDEGYYTVQAGSDWNYSMKQTMRALLGADQPPSLFLTDFGANQYGETAHILSTNPSFWLATQDGVALDQWLADAVINDDARNAGVDYLYQ